MNISLPPTMKSWVEDQVARGGYGTASEFVRQLLREERRRRIRGQIDEKLYEAIDDGKSTPMTDRDWEKLRSRIRKRPKRRRTP